MTNKAALVAQKPEELVPDLQRMWPELLQKRNIALTMAQIALLHDLSPFLQEIMLYKGNIVIAHKAKMRKALDTNKFKGYSTREATAADFKKRAWKKEDTLVAYVAEVEREGFSKPVYGYGRVTLKEYEQAQKAEEAAAKRKGEAPEDRPTFLWVLKEPADLAEKRAIDDALREAFADSIVLRLPSIEQAIVEGEYKDVTPETKPEEPTSAPPSEEKEHEGATLTKSEDPAERRIAWEAVKGAIFGSGATEPEVKHWWSQRNVEVSFDDFKAKDPPDKFPTRFLGNFVDYLNDKRPQRRMI